MYYSSDTDSDSDNFTLDDAAAHVNTIKKLDFTGKGFFLWSLRVKSCLNLFGLGNFINEVNHPRIHPMSIPRENSSMASGISKTPDTSI